MTIFWTRERKETTITLRSLRPSRAWTQIEAEVNTYSCQGKGRVARAVNQLLKSESAGTRRGVVFISEENRPATTVDRKNWG